MDKQAYFKMMGLCKDQALKLPSGTLANISKAITGAVKPQTYVTAYNALKDTAPAVKQFAGKAAVPVGAATAGTVAMNQAHKLGAQRGAAQASNRMADNVAAAYNKGLQQGAAGKSAQPGFWQRLLQYIQNLFK